MPNQYDDIPEVVLPKNVWKKFVSSVWGLTGLQAVAGPGNEGLKLRQWIQEKINLGLITLPGGSGTSNLTLGTNNGSTQIVSNSGGTGITIPAATGLIAGLLSTAGFTKLASLVNYAHPNHSGDVTSAADGATTITANTVNNIKAADMPGNTVKVNNVNTLGDPVDMAVNPSSLIGRGASGNITNITLSGATMVGNVLTVSAGGASVSNYNVVVTGGNSGVKLRVTATGAGVTAAYAGNEITVTVPTGVILISAFYTGSFSDIQSASDGGATNWVRVKFVTSYANTDLTDIQIPQVQKTFFATGTPGLVNPFTITQSNNPAQAVVGVSANSITLRFSSMSGATQGYQLTFTGF